MYPLRIEVSDFCKYRAVKLIFNTLCGINSGNNPYIW